MITYGKTTYTEGYELRTTLKVGTIQGSYGRLRREVDEMRPKATRKDFWVLGWMFGASGVVAGLAIWKAVEIIGAICHGVGNLLRVFGL